MTSPGYANAIFSCSSLLLIVDQISLWIFIQSSYRSVQARSSRVSVRDVRAVM